MSSRGVSKRIRAKKDTRLGVEYDSSRVGRGMQSILPKEFRLPTSPPKRGKPSASRHSEKWREFSLLLAGTVRVVKGWCNPSRIETWDLDFRLLHEKDGVPIETIKNVLAWYCDQLGRGRGGLPTSCFSGKMFRKHFDWIFDRYEPKAKCLLKASPRIQKIIQQALEDTDLADRRIPAVNLANLLMLVDQWFASAKRDICGLMERSVVAEPQAPRGMGLVAGVRPLILEGITDFVEWGSSGVAAYLVYVLNVTHGWENWKRELSSFFPGERYFWEFLNFRCFERWGQRLGRRERAWFEGVGIRERVHETPAS